MTARAPLAFAPLVLALCTGCAGLRPTGAEAVLGGTVRLGMSERRVLREVGFPDGKSSFDGCACSDSDLWFPLVTWWWLDATDDGRTYATAVVQLRNGVVVGFGTPRITTAGDGIYAFEGLTDAPAQLAAY